MNWDDLKVFLALARGGSVRIAAQALGVSPSTVARRIDSFEQALGVRLFDRLPDGYVLSAIGEEMIERAERAESEVLGLEREVLGQDAKLAGRIRVTMPAPVASELLMPELVRFGRIYPDIELDLAISSDIFDLSRREADVAIRFVEKPAEHLVGRRLPPFRDAVFASADYIAGHDFGGEHPSGRWIGWQDETHSPKWVRESDHPKCRTRWLVPEVMTQIAAARAGLGMAHLPCFLGDQDDQLRRVPPGNTRPARPGWVLTHPALRTTERVRVFVRFIVTAINDHADLVGGNRPLGEGET
ncbi:MAG: LysR family transcriptional regulator [Pseudomonadota bacterium]